jgi:glucose-6-phosphate isomerase
MRTTLNGQTTPALADRLTPAPPGSPVAIYERSVPRQAVICDVYPFDHWGVELGKILAGNITPGLEGTTPSPPTHVISTTTPIRRHRAWRAIAP